MRATPRRTAAKKAPVSPTFRVSRPFACGVSVLESDLMFVHLRVGEPLSSTITCTPTRTQATWPLSALSTVTVAPRRCDEMCGAHRAAPGRAADVVVAGWDPQPDTSNAAPPTTAANVDTERT